jgi:3-hydroxyisobutyrate dehydrogenase
METVFSDVLQSVYLDSDNSIVPAFTKIPRGEPTLVIDSTTLDIAVARDVARQVDQAGAMMVDAPVSGGECLYAYMSTTKPQTMRLG